MAHYFASESQSGRLRSPFTALSVTVAASLSEDRRNKLPAPVYPGHSDFAYGHHDFAAAVARLEIAQLLVNGLGFCPARFGVLASLIPRVMAHRAAQNQSRTAPNRDAIG